MLTIINNKTNPYYNLALEEYVLKFLEFDEDMVFMWQNDPSVIIGRNQNTIEEINNTYVHDHDIHVVRRNSGGGTVYHDLGNINFSFISKNIKEHRHNFKKFTQPVINALKELGINAEFTGRNDIVVNDKKISGNAQYYYKDKMLHHGTLLFNSNLDNITKVLNVNLGKIQSKSIKSVRSSVTNILPLLKDTLSVTEFKTKLLHHIIDIDDLTKVRYQLTDEDEAHIQKLVENKYKTWEWNYGESPHFNIQKRKHFKGGEIDVRIDVSDGIIKGFKIFGDFFGTNDIENFEKQFIDKRYEENEIEEVLQQESLEKYLHHISKEEFMECLFECH